MIPASHRIAAVEASIPCGACTGYALLGGELIESHLDSLEVVVSVNPEGEQFKSFLVPTGDEARISLEDVYVRGVMAGIEGMNETHGLPSRASLHFRWAAHGEVGSSVLMFAMLSRLVLQLLAVPRDASYHRALMVTHQGCPQTPGGRIRALGFASTRTRGRRRGPIPAVCHRYSSPG